MGESQNMQLILNLLGPQQYSIEYEASSRKGDGNISDTIFVKLTSNDDTRIEKNLVAKLAKTDPKHKETFAPAYTREINFYTKVVPLFQQIQSERLIKQPFRSLAACYNKIDQDTDIVLLENMVKNGYELHAKGAPMNIKHIKLVLKGYAKFHALSFALRDQKKEAFNIIEDTCYQSFPMNIFDFENLYNNGVKYVIKNLNEIERSDLAMKYEKIMGKVCVNINNVFKDVPENRVVIHGDCHNGNFLFKYEKNQKDIPSDVVFIDFQMSFMHSPMADISYYLFCVTSQTEMNHFVDLMDFYYYELSSFLSQLGSDVNKLFPKTMMWEHLKKYSLFGFAQASCFLEILCVDEENAPELDDVENNTEKYFNLNLKNRSLYLERLVAIVDHYVKYMND